MKKSIYALLSLSGLAILIGSVWGFQYSRHFWCEPNSNRVVLAAWAEPAIAVTGFVIAMVGVVVAIIFAVYLAVEMDKK